MAQEKGSVAVATIGRQTAIDTAATGNFLQLPIVSVTGGLTQELEESEALQANRNPAEPDLGPKDVALTIVLEADVRSLGFILAEAFGLPTTTGPVSGVYTHVFKVGSSVPVHGFTLETFFAINSLPFQYIGCKINGMSFELARGGKLKVTLNVVGRDGAENTRIDSAPYKYALSPLRMAAAELYESAIRFRKATRFSLDFSNNMQATELVANDGCVGDHLEGIARPNFGLTAVLDGVTEYNKAKNGTPSALAVKFPSKTDITNHYARVDLNEVRFKRMTPPIEGPGGATVTLDGMAYWATDAGNSAIIWTLANDVVSYAAIPA